MGGAHAIAAMAYGYDGFDRCDVIVGPGNAWVTAAKQLVSGVVGIDMLAGPSELLVLADESASIETLAADLLAQAEHDTDAIPMLVERAKRGEIAVDHFITHRFYGVAATAQALDALHGGDCLRAVVQYTDGAA